jgi:hypothetical protein
LADKLPERSPAIDPPDDAGLTLATNDGRRKQLGLCEFRLGAEGAGVKLRQIA